MTIQSVVVPDRYESLRRRASGQLQNIIVPISKALDEIDKIYKKMQSVDRGAFLILRGESGAGKSTFLHTLDLYRERVRTISVPPSKEIRDFLNEHLINKDFDLDVFVLEEREAAISFSDSELEEWLHAINGFIRSERGCKSLVVWPCNTDILRDRVVKLADQIGAEALLGTSGKWFNFEGPEKSQYITIAERTLSTLNQSAGFSDLGLTREDVESVAKDAKTVGSFLTRLHDKIDKAQQNVKGLISKEQCRLWVVVISGNDTAPDVAGLTRGSVAAIDTERLMTSTRANIVNELKKQPDKIGILGTVLDAKILHLPLVPTSAIARAFADSGLKLRFRQLNFALKPDDQSEAIRRLQATELARIFLAGSQSVLARGVRAGSQSVEAFEKLAEIASTNDSALNKTIARALQEAELIDSFELEKDFGSGLTRRTDILAQTKQGPIRIEVMWRKKTSRADIANYTLTKLGNYGKAIGFL